MNPLTHKSTQAGRWDFFQHAERRAGGVHPHDIEPSCYSQDFPAGTTLGAALLYMWSIRMPKSSARAGCYEVQTPDGIFSQVNESRMDLTTARRAAKIIGKTWEQLEAEDTKP